MNKKNWRSIKGDKWGLSKNRKVLTYNFNLPNNNFGVVEEEGKIFLCEDGSKIEKCEQCKEKCKKVKICSFATELCKRRCYGNNCRTLDTRLKFAENYAFSKSDNFVSEMKDKIEKILKMEKNKKIYFRIHSIGEYYSKEYFEKWLKIAEFFVNKKIEFVSYTKRYDILWMHDCKKHPIPSNFKILISVMPDTFWEKYIIEGKEYTGNNLEKLIEQLSEKYNSSIYLVGYKEMLDKMFDKKLAGEKNRMDYMLCRLHEDKQCIKDCVECYEKKSKNYIIEYMRNKDRLVNVKNDMKWLIREKDKNDVFLELPGNNSEELEENLNKIIKNYIG